MTCPIGPAEIEKLKVFVAFCSQQPSILNLPQLEFFKTFIEKLGGTVPAVETSFKAEAKAESTTFTAPPKDETPVTPQAESEESDVELDREGCVEPDEDEPQQMGETEREVSEDDMDKASEIRSKAAGAFSEQKYDEAVSLYTEAILLNPSMALFYAKRGQTFLKLQKPNACIRDCDRALELNCDSAAAYKFRGRANRLLGNFEEAARDLRQACKLDFDEESDEWLKEVTPNAKKIEQHKVKQERRRAEKELRERQERVRRAQEARRKAEEEEKERQQRAADDDGEPNMGDFMGGMGGADILGAFKDPEVAAALQDIMANPENISKYQNNPKIMNLMAKLSAMGGGGGGMGGMFGGMPGMGAGMPGMGGGMPGAGFGMPGAGGPPFGGGAPKPPKPETNDDGLD